MNVHPPTLNSVPDIPGLPVCHLNSPGTNTEDSELTEWLRENGADEDTISRVKKTLCGTSFLSPHVIVWGAYCELVTGETLGEPSPALPSWG